MQQKLSRRGFFGLGTAFAVSSVLAESESPVTIDPNLSILISDPHVPAQDVPLIDPKDKDFPNQMYERLVATVDEILAMRPRPAVVACLGDIAYLRGRAADYKVSRPVLKRLEDAGIRLVLGMGNHDHREAFFESWPDRRAKSPVPGLVIDEASLGPVDLIMLDTLWENKMPESGNKGSGIVETEQLAWMKENLPKRTRPFLLASHQSPRDVMLGKETLDRFATKLPMCRGLVHGHNHAWNVSRTCQWYGSYRVLRAVGIPSVGFWGDIGYAVCRAYPDRVEVTNVQTDFYFPRYRKENRPADWSVITRDNNGLHCTFVL